MPDPESEWPAPRAWLQVPGYPSIEARQVHDITFHATVTDARTVRNGEHVTYRALLSDEVAYMAQEPEQAQVEVGTQAVTRLMHHVNDLDQRLAQHRAALPELMIGTGETTGGTPMRPLFDPGTTTAWGSPKITGTATFRAVSVYANDWMRANETFAINTQQVRQAMLQWQAVWNQATTYGAPNPIRAALDLGGVTVDTPYFWLPKRALTIAEQAVAAGTALMRQAPGLMLRQIADVMSEALLAELIGMERFDYWRKNGVIYVSSRKFKHKLRYELRHGAMIRLHESTTRGWRKRRDKLCIHPLQAHPRGDELVALYALASFDEDTLWKIANHHYKDEETPLPLAA